MAGDGENGEMGFQYRGEKNGEETMSSTMPVFKSLNSGGGDVGDTFFGPGWEQLISLNRHHGENYVGISSSMGMPHSEFANPNYPFGMVNQGISNSISNLRHYPSSGSGLGELMSNLSGIGNANLAEMVGAFGVREDGVSSPNGKRKLGAVDSQSPINPNMNSEGDRQMDNSRDELSKDQNEKKPKIEKNSGTTNGRGKNTGKQAKETSQSGEAPKEDYIHVRARRGQATNSHSLAERVRREKIGKRMKMLQDLVPGCNKITGKSVMLDEIINYVQSLQQQVEFLSMKLATVNPELNIDLDRILSKDIHSRDANATILGIASGTNTTHHPYSHVGILQGNLQGIPSTTPQFHPMPQAVWDPEIQSLLQMGYDSNPGFQNLGQKDAQNPSYQTTLDELNRTEPYLSLIEETPLLEEMNAMKS